MREREDYLISLEKFVKQNFKRLNETHFSNFLIILLFNPLIANILLSSLIIANESNRLDINNNNRHPLLRKKKDNGKSSFLYFPRKRRRFCLLEYDKKEKKQTISINTYTHIQWDLVYIYSKRQSENAYDTETHIYSWF